MVEAFIAFCFLSVARCCQVPSFRLWTQTYNSLWEGVSELQQNNVESWLLQNWVYERSCHSVSICVYPVSSRVYIHMYSPYDQAGLESRLRHQQTKVLLNEFPHCEGVKTVRMRMMMKKKWRRWWGLCSSVIVWGCTVCSWRHMVNPQHRFCGKVCPMSNFN